jgi:hypothetical protein
VLELGSLPSQMVEPIRFCQIFESHIFSSLFNFLYGSLSLSLFYFSSLPCWYAMLEFFPDFISNSSLLKNSESYLKGGRNKKQKTEKK